MNNLQIIDLNLIDYISALRYQENLFYDNIKKKAKNEKTQNYLLLCEHPHVYTLGKSGEKNNLLINSDFLKKINATFHETNRGGDITYHGQGQIVGYPILNLENFNIGVREYIVKVENIIIDVLADYGIKSEKSDEQIGVWIDKGTKNERKICALGVKVSRGITMHGFALNINTDLSYFNHINPCGFTDKGVTSMQKELGREVDIEEVKNKIINIFVKKMKSE